MLMWGWDTMLRVLFASKEADVLDSTYEDIGGPCVDSGIGQTYKRRPTMTWMAWAPHIPMHDLDTSPSKSSTLKVDTEELSKRYRLPIGQELFRDACWRLPEHFDMYRIKDVGLIHRNMNVLEGCERLSVSNELFILPLYGTSGAIFVAHQRSSSSHEFRSEWLSKRFYEQCDRLLANAEVQTAAEAARETPIEVTG